MYSFGTVLVAVPAPVEHVEVFATLPRLRELIAGPLGTRGDVLAGYALPQDLRLLQQASQVQLATFAMLATSPELRSVDVSEGTFAALADRLRTGLGDAIRRNEGEMAAAVSDFGKQVGGNLVLQDRASVGVFDDAPGRIGVLIAARYSINSATVSVLIANTILRVRDRLLFAYMYTWNLQPDGMAALTTRARAWTDSIFEANRPTPPRPGR